MMRLAIYGLAGILLLPVLVIGAAAGVFGGATPGVSVGRPAAYVETLAGIPAEYLRLFEAAGARYGVPWEVLAGIGKVECDDGQSPDPSCTRQGAVNYAGAGGPMQFLASTWASYGVSVNGGPPDRWNPADAIFTAARYLKANGAPRELSRAIYAYNHSTEYVETVLRWAAIYEREAQTLQSQPSAAVGGAAERALSFALSQQGVPYVWGGESPAGYDCSGLVQAAYRAAGISLPRVAQEQFDAGPHLPADAQLQPGDLVFFGYSAGEVEHVGIVMRPGVMVDAPYPGTVVRTDSFPTTVGAAFGKERYLGATRPAAGARP